jgi:hypothetical protein
MRTSTKDHQHVYDLLRIAHPGMDLQVEGANKFATLNIGATTTSC